MVERVRLGKLAKGKLLDSCVLLGAAAIPLALQTQIIEISDPFLVTWPRLNTILFEEELPIIE